MLRETRARAEASEVSSLENGRGLPCSFHVWMTRVVRGGRGGMMVVVGYNTGAGRIC